MKVEKLNEAYGQSSELDDFVYFATGRFSTYYQITLKLDTGNTSVYNFRDRTSAEEQYDKLVKASTEDPVYYANSVLTLNKVEVNLDVSEEKFDYLAEEDE